MPCLAAYHFIVSPGSANSLRLKCDAAFETSDLSRVNKSPPPYRNNDYPNKMSHEHYMPISSTVSIGLST